MGTITKEVGEFNPTHKHGYYQIEVLGDIVFETAPHDGLVCILYRDKQGNRYAKTLEDFESYYELINPDPYL